MERIKCIVFDVMGVIFEEADDVANLLIPFIERECGYARRDEIQRRYREASLGLISARDFWVGISDDYPEVQRKYLDFCLKVDPNFFPTIETLKEKYLLAILSNDVGEWSKHLRDKHGYGKFFGEIVISSDVQSRKPDEKIYRILISRLQGRQIIPLQCIFIDDRLRNLKTAKDLGIKTIHLKKEEDSFDFQPDFTLRTLREMQKIL